LLLGKDLAAALANVCNELPAAALHRAAPAGPATSNEPRNENRRLETLACHRLRPVCSIALLAQADYQLCERSSARRRPWPRLERLRLGSGDARRGR
jgi:hypothetical protein